METRLIWNDRGEQEILLFGEYVGICRNFDWREEPAEGGVLLRRVPRGDRYIGVFNIHSIDENGVADVDEDHPLAHGFGLEIAEQLNVELAYAIAHLKSLL